MAQLVARLVRNEKVGGSNPPSSTGETLARPGRRPETARVSSYFRSLLPRSRPSRCRRRRVDLAAREGGERGGRRAAGARRTYPGDVTLTVLVPVPGGTFRMGSDRHYPEEGPAHDRRVEPFLLERHAVTNAQFAAFVADTGYVTVAERPLDA